MTYLSLDKSKESIYKKTRTEVLKNISPSSQQTIKEKKFIDKVLKKINKTSGSHISAIVAGSFGKGTNLKDSMDFDVFVLYPPSLPKEQFIKEGLDLGQKIFKGYFWEKAYSQHPYIRGIIDGYKVEIVPAYKINPGDPIISAVDRTSLHLLFIEKNISASQKNDVRLLKYFMKKIGCYGANSEVSGFSGYLCELLILFYGDFLTLLKHSANWILPIKFTLVKEQHINLERFNDPLVVIDPVDNNRNVASAVEERQLNIFIAASRVFLENPNINFFNKKIVNQMTYHQLVGRLKNFPMVCLEFDVKGMLKEVVWSKVRRNTKKLLQHLDFVNFNVLKYEIYYKENYDKAYLIIMVDSLKLPYLKQIIGPLVSDFKSSQNYLQNIKCIFGPYIKENRWYAIRQRDRIDIKGIILEYIIDNFDLGCKLYVGEEIRDLYLKDEIVSEYFSDFFISKEKFLI
jgi:tRNA nucleotidyltransferase (CCA-adding enzyme)